MTYIDENGRVWVDDMTVSQLFESLLWSTWDADGTPWDECHERGDISRESQDELIETFRAFVGNNVDALDAYREHTNRDWDDVAHDWVLDSKSHGTGFWDRCYCGKCDDVKFALSDACQYGVSGVYKGDDGQLHIIF